MRPTGTKHVADGAEVPCYCDHEHRESWHQQGCPQWDADADHTFARTPSDPASVDASEEADLGEAVAAINRALSDPQSVMLHSWEEVRRAWRDIHTALTAAQRENADLRRRVERMEGVVEAARGGCDKCEGDYDDTPTDMCADIWGCGFAATRAALAALDREVAP